MQWKATLATTALLLAISPIAHAEEQEPATADWTCAPGSDKSAVMVSISGQAYYEKLYQSSGYWIEEVWQETNSEKGLQTSSSMSCAGKADKLVFQACVGWCPFSF